MTIASVSCAVAQSPSEFQQVKIDDAGSIQIPSNATLSRNAEGNLDFSVYLVRQQQHLMLNIYLGRWPDFPRDIAPTVSQIGGCAAYSVTRTKLGLTSRDVGIEIQETPDERTRKGLHFFYRDLTADEATLSNRIIKS